MSQGHKDLSAESLTALSEYFESDMAKNALEHLAVQYPVDAHIHASLPFQMAVPAHQLLGMVSRGEPVTVADVKEKYDEVLSMLPKRAATRTVAELFLNKAFAECGINLRFSTREGFLDKQVEKHFSEFSELSSRRLFEGENEKYLDTEVFKAVAAPVIERLFEKLAKYPEGNPSYLDETHKNLLFNQTDNMLNGKMSRHEYHRDIRIAESEGRHEGFKDIKQRDPFRPNSRGYNTEILHNMYRYMHASGGSPAYQEAVNRLFASILDELIAREKSLAGQSR